MDPFNIRYACANRPNFGLLSFREMADVGFISTPWFFVPALSPLRCSTTARFRLPFGCRNLNIPRGFAGSLGLWSNISGAPMQGQRGITSCR